MNSVYASHTNPDAKWRSEDSAADVPELLKMMQWNVDQVSLNNIDVSGDNAWTMADFITWFDTSIMGKYSPAFESDVRFQEV